jgi:hypothetical protein
MNCMATNVRAIIQLRPRKCAFPLIHMPINKDQPELCRPEAISSHYGTHKRLHESCRSNAALVVNVVEFESTIVEASTGTSTGLLRLVNRMVAVHSTEWARWVILLALGGFFGNLVLTLTDHASNGFFVRTEWIPVISSAFATGFLIIPVITTVTRRFLDLCLILLIVQALVGVLGFWLHMQANLVAPEHSLFDKLVNGAPALAPLLFPNLVGLAFIGLWALIPHVAESTPGSSWLGSTYLGFTLENRERADTL